MAKPLRVLHVISGLHLGGAETLLYRLATAPNDVVRHEVICLGDRQWYSSLLEEHGVTVHHLGMTPANFAPKLLRLRKLIRESGADVLQSWLYVANVLSGLLARPAGIPVVWSIHASTPEHIGPVSRLCAQIGARQTRRLADFVIYCSSRSAELHADLGYGTVRNALIHNGYDPHSFCPDEDSRAETRRQLGVDEDTFLIGSVARWHAQKDIPNLLRAARQLLDCGLPVKCLLVGGGLDSANADLHREVECAGLTNAVILAGARSNVRDYYRALDLHVLASSGSEAFPNVVAESMLCGTPNVVTDVGDSAFMVADSGWVVPPRNSAALAKAIADAHGECSADRNSWEKRRRDARSRIADRFTFECMVEAYRGVWLRVASPG
jgi:glycosyltransferase involved in cell wall biosynthesis